jgi:hypothetical protein
VRCWREVDVDRRPRPAEIRYRDFQGDRAIFQRARLAAPTQAKVTKSDVERGIKEWQELVWRRA